MFEAKTIEDVEKQTGRKLHWEGKVPGTCAGFKAAAVPGLVPGTGVHGHRSFGREPDQ